jgi:hypothetical protein
MGRWTDLQKEMNGHKRKLAYKKHEVSLKTAPWEEDEDESDRDNGSGTSERTEKEVREGT